MNLQPAPAIVNEAHLSEPIHEKTDPDVSVEYVCGLSKCQIIGYLVEVLTVFPLLYPHALEQESPSCNLVIADNR